MLTTATSSRFDTLLTAEKERAHVAAGYWSTTTLIDDLDRHAGEQPDAPALVVARRRLTWSEYRRLVYRTGATFSSLGVRQGDIVSFQLPAGIEYNLVELGLILIGAVPNPLLLSYGAHELSDIVERTVSRLFIAPGSFRGREPAKAAAAMRLHSVEKVLAVGDPVPDGDVSFERLLEEPWEDRVKASELAARRPKASDVCAIIYSAGTTGRPKGIMHTHNTMRRASIVCAEMLGIDSSDAGLPPPATGTAGGSLLCVYMPLVLGCKAVLLDAWDPERALQAIPDERIAWSYGPTVFPQTVIRNPRRSEFDLSSMRVWGSGGAPIPRELFAEAKDAGFRLQSMFGGSEPIWVTSQRVDDPPHKLAESDGRVVPGMELRVVDENGKDVPPGEVGEFLARGPQVCLGYYGDAEMTKLAFDDDGWYHSGDLVTMDADGYVKVVGRVKDMIIRKGLNIYPLEIEHLLQTHPAVGEIAIIGLPDPESGERACACVVPRPGTAPPRLEDLVQFLKDKGVAPFKWPEQVEILSELPHGPTGKVLKYRLKEEVLSGSA